MLEKKPTASVVSFEIFKALYDQQIDFCRKLRFFTKARFFIEEEGLAFDIVEDLLDQRERELEEMRKKGFEDRKDVELSPESMETILGRYLMQHEDYKMLLQIEEVRKNGGSHWEILKSILQRGDHDQGAADE